MADIGLGSAARMAAIVLAVVLPLKAGFPVIISYKSEPSAKISERTSASFPSTCSGDMYWKVPTILPSAVSGCDIVANEWDVELARAATAAGFARPKSISLAPDLVIMI